jgi:flavin reductase (DIM6/NTAB) family NADH-FMN oxidoreductase RutF
LTLDCELIECIDAGTHALIIGKIVAGQRAPDLSPLIYVDGNWAGVDMRLVHA